jgi:Flp pilus assembly protein CpaB
MQFAQKLFSTRGGTIAVGALAAALAAAVFVLYLHRYRASLQAAGKPMTVLVASGLIEKGTPGAVIASEDLFQVTTTPKGELKDGAITDPDLLRGRIAADDIFPGAQLTTAQFTAGATDTVSARVIEYERGIAVPVDEAHGMIGKVVAGDKVDVIAGFVIDGSDGKQHPVTFLLVQDVLVLDVPEEAKAGFAAGANKQSVVLRLTDEEATKTAYASEYGKVWIAVRPRSGAEQSLPARVTLDRLLAGLKPIPAGRFDGSNPGASERR